MFAKQRCWVVRREGKIAQAESTGGSRLGSKKTERDGKDGRVGFAGDMVGVETRENRD